MSDNLVLFLVGQAVFFLLGMIRIYVIQEAKNQKFEIEIQTIKAQGGEYSRKMDQLADNITRKFDTTQRDIVEIKLALKDKANKPV